MHPLCFGETDCLSCIPLLSSAWRQSAKMSSLFREVNKMLLFYCCYATAIIAGWWVTRASACAVLQLLGATPQVLTFCVVGASWSIWWSVWVCYLYTCDVLVGKFASCDGRISENSPRDRHPSLLLSNSQILGALLSPTFLLTPSFFSMRLNDRFRHCLTSMESASFPK